MPDLNMPLQHLKFLSLAADPRFGATNYTSDHIWELVSSSGEPGGLDLQTTFGLRARSLRIFPRFTEENRTISSPADFDASPVIKQMAGNFARVAFAPFPGIDVICDYWVPDSHSIACRFLIQNTGVTMRTIRFDLVALLSPGNEGSRMVAEKLDGTAVLSGNTDGLFPLLFLTGGAEIDPGPHPALSFYMTLMEGTSYQTTAVLAADDLQITSLAHAREVAARSWDAEIARLEIINESDLEIHTGNPDWNRLFALARQTARRCIVGPGPRLPYMSFVLRRSADEGYSPRGDGSDYGHLWNGQPSLEAHYLVHQLLPASATLAQDFIRNYLFIQDQDTGFIDWRPGLGGQRSHLSAAPLLADLAWTAYEYTHDRVFLREIFEPLLNFMRFWFTPGQDADADGVPEFDHPAQLGYEDHPLFAFGQPDYRGQDIALVEHPALGAFLYRDCLALQQIAGVLGRTENISALQTVAENIRAAVESAWDPNREIYSLWDRDHHRSLVGVFFEQHEGNGSLPAREKFDEPNRLVLRLRALISPPAHPQVTLFGRDAAGKPVEVVIPPEQWQWVFNQGAVTTSELFSSVESIKIQGLSSEDQLAVYTYDTSWEDLSLFFPLWAQIPSPQTARHAIEGAMSDTSRYWSPYGFRAFPSTSALNGLEGPVLMLWNNLAGEGLLRYGFRKRAAELYNHLMSGLITSFRKNGVFFGQYSSVDGLGKGEEDVLTGLPPLSLFLETLGVRIFSPWRVRLEGFNPFPWPVRLRCSGLTVERRNDKTILTFPDGQTVVVDSPHPCIVSLEGGTSP